MKTACGFCVFKISENGVQTGCHLNKLDLFSKEVVDGDYVLDGLCFTCRNEYWRHSNKPVEEMKDILLSSLLRYRLIINIYSSTTPKRIKYLARRIQDEIKVQPEETVFLMKTKGGFTYDLLGTEVSNTVISLGPTWKLAYASDARAKRLRLQLYDKIEDFFCIVNHDVNTKTLVDTINLINENLVYRQEAPQFIKTPDEKFIFISRRQYLEHGLQYEQNHSNHCES